MPKQKKVKKLSPAELKKRFKKTKLLLMDLDGTLTDSSVMVLPGNDRQAFFSVRDGYGLALLREHGIQLGIVTGSRGTYVEERAKSLKIEILRSGTLKKLAAYLEIRDELGLKDEEIVYVGDDFPDAAVFAHCGVGVAIGDGMPSVIARAHYVTKAKGGHGAIREVCEWIREAKGWPETWE